MPRSQYNSITSNSKAGSLFSLLLAHTKYWGLAKTRVECFKYFFYRDKSPGLLFLGFAYCKLHCYSLHLPWLKGIECGAPVGYITHLLHSCYQARLSSFHSTFSYVLFIWNLPEKLISQKCK